jgi:hypothetical protein
MSIIRGVAGLLLVLNVAAVGATSQGHMGDPLTTALHLRSQETGEKFILTRKALAKEREAGTPAFLSTLSLSTVVQGWTLIHLPDEDLSIIEQRAERNLKVWKHMLTKEVKSGLVKPTITGLHVASVNQVFFAMCGVSLDLNFPKTIFIFFLDAKGTPKKDLCHDYMLILAANDIIVTRKDGKLVAELDPHAPKNESSEGVTLPPPATNGATTPR